jgi:hypothetical protein
MRPSAPNIAAVLAFMSEHGLALDDLIWVGDEDLKSTNPVRRQMASRVSRCWEIMARGNVNFAQLEAAVGAMPAAEPRRRRHRLNSAQAVDNAEKSRSGPPAANSNKINNLANSAGLSGQETELAR